nr:MAG TPA: hypothetical protein [Caudoviricetes sp.]
MTSENVYVIIIYVIEYITHRRLRYESIAM